MKALTFILYPFAILYDVITTIRNRLYDTGTRPSVRFDIPVIGVGNLSVGGTGKTPMIEYLIRLLGNQFKVATLSRGYGRKTRGIRLAVKNDNAATLGDEPMQFYQKFGDRVVVAVGEERVLAIPYILHHRPEVEVILLDDAFQHRRVKPSFQILLTDYSKLFMEDHLLPAGRLRESKRGAARADVIVVTKCPRNLSDDRMMELETSIRNFSTKAVFFSTIAYGSMLPVEGSVATKPDTVILVAGIANPQPLEEHLERECRLVKRYRFRDHHAYSENELNDICSAATALKAAVVTTEKDLVKIDPAIFRRAGVGLYYLPIQMEFIKSGKEFDEMVLNAVEADAQ